MKNNIKRIFNKKGLTLAEILVVLFISSVILVIATGMVAPVQNLLKSVKNNAHMDTMCNTANEYIRGTIQAAKTLYLYRLDDQNNFVSEEEKNKAESVCASTNVLAVLNINAGTDEEPVYRIFDLGTVDGFSTLQERVSSHNEEEYGVFNAAFYEDSSYAVEFNANSQWLQVRSQCKKNGEAINQKRELKFNFLNGGASSSLEGFSVSNEGGVDEATEDQYVLEGGAYLIVYTRVAA